MKPKSEIVIFGAGRWGKAALAYYQGRSPVAGFIDNDSSIWGSKIEGVLVYSPDILKDKSYGVVIAVKNNLEEIKQELFRKYGIKKAAFFQVNLVYDDLSDASTAPTNIEEIIIKFQGGLGNQMFQYAVYRNFEEQGKNVRADLFSYIISNKAKEEGAFLLPDVFPGIEIKECNASIRRKYLNTSTREHGNELCYRYIEPVLPKEVFLDNWILDSKAGFLEGYFQSYKYPQLVKEKLREVFQFRSNNDIKFQGIIDMLQRGEFVGIHFRRGDYLSRTNQIIYGNPCSDDYYVRALNLLKTKIKSMQICLFSNDIAWVKDCYPMDNAIYIEPKMFDHYEDWYDMCLMSYCKHNVIANSTFSWWGAWLNANPDKIVIAPKKWVRKEGAMQDICPPDWIRI